jgi:hypothetical protein
VQNLAAKPGESLKWTFGAAKGDIAVDGEGIPTIPGLKIAARPETLTIRR